MAAELVVCLNIHDIRIDVTAVTDKSINVSQIMDINVVQIDKLVYMNEWVLTIVDIGENQEAVFRMLFDLGLRTKCILIYNNGTIGYLIFS